MKKPILLSVVLIILVILIYKDFTLETKLSNYDYHIKKSKLKSGLITEKSHKSEINQNYRILLWTLYFGTDAWLKLSFKDLSCQYSNCILSSNTSDLDTSDAVVFHWRDFDVYNMPERRYYKQKWVLMNLESPNYTPVGNIHALNGRFDWIMSYLTDSDVYIPYGKIEKCKNDWKPKFDFRRKTRSIAWIVSHCETFSKREVYVEKLRQFIDVDIYGTCGNMSCKHGASCYHMIEQKYRFYLSFENSLCKDYVTEKLFHYIQYDIIPIVMGSANYSSLMPPNSYIDVSNFPSPLHLANYLKEVISDENKYKSYFDWKSSYCVTLTHYTYFCKLCEKLNVHHSSPDTSGHKMNLIKWYFEGSNCRNR